MRSALADDEELPSPKSFGDDADFDAFAGSFRRKSPEMSLPRRFGRSFADSMTIQARRVVTISFRRSLFRHISLIPPLSGMSESMTSTNATAGRYFRDYHRW